MPVFAGFAAIGAAVGVTGAVSGVIVGMAISAAVGAAIGGITAAVTGGDIGTGMLYGAVGGLVVGGIWGGSIVGGITGEVAVAPGAEVATQSGTVFYGGTEGAVVSGETLASAGGAKGAGFGLGGLGGGGGAGGGSSLSGDLATAAISAAPALYQGMNAPDPDELTAAQQAELDYKYAELEAAKARAGGGGGFHLEERLALQRDAQEARLKEMSEKERMRKEGLYASGRMRKAARNVRTPFGRGGEQKGALKGAAQGTAVDPTKVG